MARTSTKKATSSPRAGGAPSGSRRAKSDAEEAKSGVLRLSREDQIAFWQALQNPPPPTEAQRRLGELIRSVM